MKDTAKQGNTTMPTHKTGTRKEWLDARLEAEKELTRRSDGLARRQELPWVRIHKGSTTRHG
jgi:predicted dithiol-disulfide oxidoreductase (DUF899 family)